MAEKSSGLTGPCQITILLPTAHGTSVNVWTNASTTAVSTKLYLTIGSYALTTSGPVLVAEALQTIDRSTVNGTVQAFLTASGVANPANQEVNSSGTFTDTVWKNFPLNDLRQNPNLGTFYEYDPAYNPTATLPPYAEWTSAHNAVTVIAGTSLAEAKQLVVSTEASTADQDAAALQFPGPVTMSGAKAWAFEVDLDVVSVTNADQEYLVGLVAASTLSDDVPFADTGVLADVDFVGFATTAAAGDDFGATYRANGETAVIHDQNAGTATANTAITLCMYYDGATIAVYVDGTLVADPILAADIVDTTDVFPEGIVGYLTFGLKADSGTAETDDLNIRAFRVAQLS